jgi:peptide-methionine (R)-S-oxide reductase
VVEAGLDIGLTEGLEAEARIQRHDIPLGVQQHRLVTVQAQNLRDQQLREALAAAVRSGGDPAEEAAGVAVGGFGIHDDAQVGGGTALVGDPQVLGCRLLVAVVELFFVDALLDEKDVGAQFEKAVELVDGELAPRLAHDGIRGHQREFNEGMGYNVEKTEEEWLAELGPERYAVLRKAGTERAWTGELLDESRAGFYTCAACGNELFKSGTKFDSNCGWPSFYESVNPEAVELLEDTSLGVVRTEVRCANCGSHLGHVFDDGFGTPTGDRYCMNSLSLEFKESE